MIVVMEKRKLNMVVIIRHILKLQNADDNRILPLSYIDGTIFRTYYKQCNYETPSKITLLECIPGALNIIKQQPPGVHSDLWKHLKNLKAYVKIL